MITGDEALHLARKFIQELSNTITQKLATKVDKDGAVTGVKGSSESEYRTGNVSITKENIGLGSVNNTSDADKPISDATQIALNTKLNSSDLNLFQVITPSFSSLPKTFYSSALKSNCKVVGDAIELSYPKAGSIDWKVAFADGSLTISGTFKGSTATTASMSIWVPTQTITLSANQ